MGALSRIYPEAPGADVAKLTSADKALLILTTITMGLETPTLGELCRSTGLTKSTVHRLLAVLCTHKLVTRIGDRYTAYSIDNFGSARQCGIGRLLAVVHDESMPFLVGLYNETQATASVSVLIDNDVHLVSQVFGHQGLRIATPTNATETVLRAGVASPNADDASGRLAKVRRAGIAFSGDARTGTTDIAVPVCHDVAELPSAIALSINGRIGQYSPARAANQLRLSAFSFARALLRLPSGLPHR